MGATESVVPITAGSGTNVDVVTFSTTNRQVVSLGDASAQGQFALIDASGAQMVVVDDRGVFDLLLREQRRTNLLLAQAFGLEMPSDNDLEEGFSQ